MVISFRVFSCSSSWFVWFEVEASLISSKRWNDLNVQVGSRTCFHRPDWVWHGVKMGLETVGNDRIWMFFLRRKPSMATKTIAHVIWQSANSTQKMIALNSSHFMNVFWKSTSYKMCIVHCAYFIVIFVLGSMHMAAELLHLPCAQLQLDTSKRRCFAAESQLWALFRMTALAPQKESEGTCNGNMFEHVSELARWVIDVKNWETLCSCTTKSWSVVGIVMLSCDAISRVCWQFWSKRF